MDGPSTLRVRGLKDKKTTPHPQTSSVDRLTRNRLESKLALVLIAFTGKAFLPCREVRTRKVILRPGIKVVIVSLPSRYQREFYRMRQCEGKTKTILHSPFHLLCSGLSVLRIDENVLLHSKTVRHLLVMETLQLKHSGKADWRHQTMKSSLLQCLVLVHQLSYIQSKTSKARNEPWHSSLL